jgi:hypothetical protein
MYLRAPRALALLAAVSFLLPTLAACQQAAPAAPTTAPPPTTAPAKPAAAATSTAAAQPNPTAHSRRRRTPAVGAGRSAEMRLTVRSVNVGDGSACGR